ncbi:MAG: hypothetical protein JWO79_1874 [Actinomycetia bacterium]|nr:hypothetical protein [Actinomycetes bacterium]MDQ1657022.1 hypothetical protein [Cryptosporangiaceae bacterium]
MSELIVLARRLDELAARVREAGVRPARRLASIDWQCPRGDRARAEAEHLRRSAAAAAGSLGEAAGLLLRAVR